MAALAVFLIAASLAQLTFGLKPISSLSEGLNRIRERKAERMTGRYPREMQGVVDAVNKLLDAQSEIIAKARARSADLAHGLKDAVDRGGKRRGDPARARPDRHCRRTHPPCLRHAGSCRARTDPQPDRRKPRSCAAPMQDVATAVDRIVRTLKRTPRGEELAWTVEVPPGVVVGVDPNDLEELLGNVIDNAVKWSHSAIGIVLRRHGERPVLVIEDDGPGADPDGIEQIMERGIRLDSQKPGTGLGLSIVKDIASVYDLRVAIENRGGGGLRVTVTF